MPWPVASAPDGSLATVSPLLSIVVPALEVDRELVRCLDSVRLALRASPDYEVVLVLPTIPAPEHTPPGPNVRIVVETRPGVYAAMNDGVLASRGRYLYFLGKDDILLPAARQMLQLLASEAPSAVFANVYWGALGIHSTRSSRFAILFRNVCHQGIVYSRDVLTRHGPFVRRFKVRADQLLNIRVLWDDTLRPRLRHLALPIAWYAGTGLSSTTPDRVFYRVQPAIIRRHLGWGVAAAWRAYKWVRPEKGMRRHEA